MSEQFPNQSKCQRSSETILLFSCCPFAGFRKGTKRCEKGNRWLCPACTEVSRGNVIWQLHTIEVDLLVLCHTPLSNSKSGRGKEPHQKCWCHLFITNKLKQLNLQSYFPQTEAVAKLLGSCLLLCSFSFFQI